MSKEAHTKEYSSAHP